MTLTVKLTPAQEARLREEASLAGMEPAALLLARAGLEETTMLTDTSEPLSRFQEWHQNWEQSLPPTPVVQDEDLTRTALYAREDDTTFLHESKAR